MAAYIGNIIYATALLGIMGALFGALLAVAAKIFYVEEDPRIAEVRAALAGANCGACGYAGCDGYAAAVVNEGAPPNKCAPGGEKSSNAICSIMCLDATAAEKEVAYVACSGNAEVAKFLFTYDGPRDCRAAMSFGNKGPKLCRFACIGLGNCEAVCQFDAMHIVNGVAKVDREKCVACMMCAEACPKQIIKKVPYKQKLLVGCRSTDKGGVVIKQCGVGCIGCKKCENACAKDAIHVVDNLAVIDYDKCIGCGLCASVCPRGILIPQTRIPLLEKKKKEAEAKKQAEQEAEKAEE